MWLRRGFPVAAASVKLTLGPYMAIPPCGPGYLATLPQGNSYLSPIGIADCISF